MAEVIDPANVVDIAPPAVYDGTRLRGRAAIAALVGFAVLALGLAVDPARAWLSYLMAFALAFTIAVGGLVLLMIGYAANARWMAAVRRPTEIVSLPLPALAVLFVPILFGLSWLYPWHTPPAELTPHEHRVLEHRAAYLGTLPFALRAAAYFAVLLVASLLLRRWALRREERDEPRDLARERTFASAMLPLVGLAFTFAVIDWLMTLQSWGSTMFPVYLFAGGFLAAIALVTVLCARLHRTCQAPFARDHFYALGRMMFAFTVFWAYTGYFQAFLIRIANKPDEVGFYLARTDGAWLGFVWILIIGHFALPFLFLLPRAPKLSPKAMAVAAWWLVAMQLVDIYWIVIPAHVDGDLPVHWLDAGALAAVVGTCVAVAAHRQHGRPLLATRDPLFAAGVAYRSPLL